MLDPVERYISNFHVYCAVILMVVLYVNFAGPKGNDPDPARASFHVWFGRLFSWLVRVPRCEPMPGVHPRQQQTKRSGPPVAAGSTSLCDHRPRPELLRHHEPENGGLDAGH